MARALRRAFTQQVVVRSDFAFESYVCYPAAELMPANLPELVQRPFTPSGDTSADAFDVAPGYPYARNSVDLDIAQVEPTSMFAVVPSPITI